MKKTILICLLLAVCCHADQLHRGRYGFGYVVEDIITKSPWIDVRAYGATGDGVTDDTAAIQATIDVAEASDGRTILFPSGTYLANNLTIDSADTQWDPNRLEFIGYNATIKNTHASNSTFVANFTSPDSQFGLIFRGLRFDGNGETTSAISAIRCPRLMVVDCTIYNHREAGINMGDDCYNAIIRNVFAKGEDATAGVGISYSATGGNIKIYDCKVTAYLFGVRIKGGLSGGLVTGSNLYACTYGMEIKSGYGGAVVGNYFEKNTSVALLVGTTDTDFQYGLEIVGNHFDGSGGARNAIQLDYAKWVTIQGNSAVQYTNFIDASSNATLEAALLTPNYSTATNYLAGSASILGAWTDLSNGKIGIGTTDPDSLLSVGDDGSTQGTLTLWDGSGGTTPAYIKIHSPDGSAWYLFVEDDGTVKVHNAAPTQNTDGSEVGGQS